VRTDKGSLLKLDGRGVNLGGRIVKAVQNTGRLHATYHYYYGGDSAIETPGGSGLMGKRDDVSHIGWSAFDGA
jgi:hypothetical protein